jgi:DNA-binding NtrC family response regulator
MGKSFTILIADRNPRIRTFLKREMEAEGYGVKLAGNGSEVLKWAFGSYPLHLLIIDADLPDTDGLDTLKKLKNRMPSLPIIVHGFSSDYRKNHEASGPVVFVEKMGKSVERLKEVAAGMLQKADPRR